MTNDIKTTIARLREASAKQIMEIEDRATYVQCIPAILDALEDAMRKAEAGERLAKAIKQAGCTQEKFGSNCDNCSALAAYDEAIK